MNEVSMTSIFNSTTKNLQSLSLSEVPSTLNGPPGPLIGEKNRTAIKSRADEVNKSGQQSSTNKTKQLPNSSGIPSTLNGPPDLLIGEKKSTIAMRMSKPSKDLSSSQWRDEQYIRNHENSKPQAVTEQSKQSIKFDEGENGLLNLNRRMLIDDNFHQRSSVFSRLGSQVKTYSGVVGEQGGYVQQPCDSIGSFSDRPGPSKRTNNSQITNTNLKALSSNAPEHHGVQDTHHPSAQARASVKTTMKSAQTSRTLQSTTDLQQPEVTQVKTHFKLIQIMPPTKNKDAKLVSRSRDKVDLDLNLPARRLVSNI